MNPQASEAGGRSVHARSESQSRYLSLALASRKLINSLRSLKDGRIENELRDSLQNLIGTLEESRSTNLFGPMPTESPFAHYEQVMTLDEVLGELQDQRIVEKLSTV